MSYINLHFHSRPPGTCALMECALCFEVCHPTCVTDYGVNGFIKMDVPNSWECPRCIKAKEELKEQMAAAAESKEEVKTEQPPLAPVGGGPPVAKILKLEPANNDPLRRPVSSGSDANVAGAYQLFSVIF